MTTTTTTVTFDGVTVTDVADRLFSSIDTVVTHVAMNYANFVTTGVFIHQGTDDNGVTHYVVSDTADGCEVLTDRDQAWETAVAFALNIEAGWVWDIALDERIPAVSHRERPAGR